MRILVVEDDPTLAESLVGALRREGYRTDSVGEGGQALSVLAANDIDLVLLDRDLPGLSGDAVCRTLRSTRHPARVLMLTAASGVGARVDGLDMGADDYLVKPFAFAELLARIRALSRRGEGPATPVVSTWRDITVDRPRRLAERAGLPLRLTPKEFGVLALLVEAGGAPVSVDELLEEVWLDPFDRTRGVVKVAVYSLRRKLGDPPVIDFDPGHGYRLA